MYIDENLEIALSGLNGSISEVSDEDDNKDDYEDEFLDIQPEPLDSDLAEQSLFISNNKTIASIPSNNIEFGYNLIETNIGVSNLISKFRQDTYGIDLKPDFDN